MWSFYPFIFRLWDSLFLLLSSILFLVILIILNTIESLSLCCSWIVGQTSDFRRQMQVYKFIIQFYHLHSSNTILIEHETFLMRWSYRAWPRLPCLLLLVLLRHNTDDFRWAECGLWNADADGLCGWWWQRLWVYECKKLNVNVSSYSYFVVMGSSICLWRSQNIKLLTG